MNLLNRCCVLCVLTLCIPAVYASSVYTIQPGPVDGKDTYYGTVYQKSGNPHGDIIHVGGWGDQYFGFIQFDLSGAPTAAQTVKAELQLYVQSRNTNDPNIDLYRITSPWTESAISTSFQPSSQYYADIGGVTPGTWEINDITSMYKNWQDGVWDNHGVRLKPNYTWASQASMISSDNTDFPTLRPKLVIEYTGSLSSAIPAPLAVLAGGAVGLFGLMRCR